MFIDKKYIFKILRFLVVLILFVSGNSSLFAQDAESAYKQAMEDQYNGYIQEAEGLVISEVIIEKPKRSRVSYLKSLVSVKEGDIYTKDLHARMYINLWSTGVFSVISITPTVLEDQTVSLDISVVDKWTFIPFPILSFWGSGYLVGIYAYDNNFLGFGKYLSLLASYGSDSYSFGFAYFDQQLFNLNIIFSIDSNVTIAQFEEYAYGKPNISFGKDTKKIDPIRKSEGLLYNGGINLGYRLPLPLIPFVNVGYYYFNNEIKKSSKFVTTSNKYESTMGVPITVGLNTSLLLPYGIMSKGLDSGISYIYSVYNKPSNHDYSLFKARMKYGFGLDSKKINLITIISEGTYGTAPLVIAPVIGGTETSKSIVSAAIRSSKYISSSISHSIKTWEGSWGGLIFNYGGDLSYYKIAEYDDIDDPVLNGGVFTGLTLIFKKIAFPSLSLGFIYNVSNNYYGFNLGLGF